MDRDRRTEAAARPLIRPQWPTDIMCHCVMPQGPNCILLEQPLQEHRDWVLEDVPGSLHGTPGVRQSVFQYVRLSGYWPNVVISSMILLIFIACNRLITVMDDVPRHLPNGAVIKMISTVGMCAINRLTDNSTVNRLVKLTEQHGDSYLAFIIYSFEM